MNIIFSIFSFFRRAVFCPAALIIFVSPLYSQTIAGTVTDPDQAAIENADVAISSNRGTLSRTVSEADGKFSLTVNAEDDLILHVSAPGFAPFEKPLAGLPPPITIVLQPQFLRENVNVSITRTGSRLNETPASITVLDRETLDSTAAQTVDDTLRQVAGFTLFRRSSSKTANPTTQGASLRGIGGSGAARTSVLFDGISLNDAFGGWTYWSRVPVIAIDEVEVLRGGASSLYGSSALSGAINLNAAHSNSPALRFQTSAGSQGTYDGSFYAAYLKRGWGFDLAAESFQTAGYIPTSPSERGIVDTRSNSRHNSGLLTVERKFNDNFRAFARGNIFAERRDNGTSLTNNRTYFRQAVFGADYANTNVGNFQFRTSIDAQIYDQRFSAVSADRNTENLIRIQRVPSRSEVFSLFWGRSFGTHTLSAMADAREVRGFSDETAISGGRATAFISSGGRQFSFGVLAQDFWRVTGKLNVNFGAKFDRWRNLDALSSTQSLIGGQSTFVPFPDRSEQRFSPRVAALYQLTGGVSFFAAYDASFRAPSLNELYRAFRVGNVLTLANENLLAEIARTWETGANFTGFSKRLNVRGNLFLTDVSNPVVSVTLNSTPALITRQRQNVGETRTRGVELDAEFVPISKLRLSASYLLSDSRVSDFPRNTDLVGKFLPQIPRNQFTFQTLVRPRPRISLSLQGRISGGQFEDDLNTLRLRPFFSLDAFASYRFPKQFEIFAAAENIFNSRYDIGLTPNRTIAAPRFVRMGLRFNLKRNSR